MNGELVDAAASQTGDTLALPDVDAEFVVDRTGDHLRLDGRLKDSRVTITLERQPLDDFTLRNRGFHWVQEAPYFG